MRTYSCAELDEDIAPQGIYFKSQQLNMKWNAIMRHRNNICEDLGNLTRQRRSMPFISFISNKTKQRQDTALSPVSPAILDAIHTWYHSTVCTSRYTKHCNVQFQRSTYIPIFSSNIIKILTFNFFIYCRTRVSEIWS